jgi:hypothetical protein
MKTKIVFLALAIAGVFCFGVTLKTQAALTVGATTITSNDALTLTGNAASVWDLTGAALSLQTANNGAITTGNGLFTIAGSASTTVLYLPNTTGAGMGIVYKGTASFIHNYADATADGANTFVGVNAGNFTMSPNGGASLLASNNTAVGTNALHADTTSDANTAIGAFTLEHNTTGTRNSGIGAFVLQSNTTGSGDIGMGYAALWWNTTGNYNNALGNNALHFNTTGSYNTADGSSALYRNTTGDSNTALGYVSLQENTTGGLNTAAGYASLESNTSGSYNTTIGGYSLPSNTTGTHNTASGYYSLYSNTTGTYNTAIGYNAGYNSGTPLTGNSYSVFIGNNANTSVDGLTNVIVIGSAARGTKSNQAVLGNADITETLLNGKVGIGTTSPQRLLHLSTTGGTQLVFDDNNAASGLKYRGIDQSDGYLYFLRYADNFTATGYDMVFDSSGNIGIATTSPAAKLDIYSNSFILEQAQTPATSSAACTTGMHAWDSGYVYVCVATNTWKRSALSTW